MARSTPTVTERVSPRARRSPGTRRVAGTLTYLVVPVLTIAVWWYLSRASTSPYFPALPAVLDRFQEMWLFAQVGSDVVPSLARMFAGYGLAVVGGIALGVVCGRVAPLYRALSPFIHFGRAVPAAAMLPAAMALLGLGNGMKIAFIAFVCSFPVLLNTIDAVRGLEKGFEDTARTFQLTRRQRLVYLLLPFAAPQIFAGARVALSVAFIMMIVTEMLAATNGIGFVTLQAQQTFDIRSMWAGMILLGLLGVALNVVFIAVERRVVHWNAKNRES